MDESTILESIKNSIDMIEKLTVTTEKLTLATLMFTIAIIFYLIATANHNKD